MTPQDALYLATAGGITTAVSGVVAWAGRKVSKKVSAWGREVLANLQRLEKLDTIETALEDHARRLEALEALRHWEAGREV